MLYANLYLCSILCFANITCNYLIISTNHRQIVLTKLNLDELSPEEWNGSVVGVLKVLLPAESWVAKLIGSIVIGEPGLGGWRF